MTNYYSLFKPIRNKLKNISLFYSLEKINSLLKENPPPIVPEIVEFLFINSVLYCPDYDTKNKKEESDFNQIINKSIDLHNLISDNYIESDSNSIWGYMRRLFLNQFKIKQPEVTSQVYRYHKFYSEPDLSNHIKRKIKISYYDFLLCSLWLFSVFIKKYYVEKTYFYNVNTDSNSFFYKKISITLELLSLPFSEFKIKMNDYIKYDINMFHLHGKQHYITPIIEFNNYFICMYPSLLFLQSTYGVYFITEMFDSKYKLNKALGTGFENYIYDVLNKINTKSKYKIIKEFPYKNNQNLTTDFLLINNDEIVLIECKTKKQTIQTKIFSTGVDSDSEIFSYAAKQLAKVYKVIDAYQNKHLCQIPFRLGIHFTPIIVFLEDGYFFDVNEEISKQTKVELENSNIDSNIIDKYPYYFFSSYEFEYKAQIMFDIGFKNYFEQLKCGRISQKYLESYPYTNLFIDEFQELFIDPLKTSFQT